jgi:hypothetical protein
MPDTIDLVITVAERDADDIRRFELAGHLMRYLRSAAAGTARRATGGAAVPGTRGMDPATVGALVVAVQTSAALLSDVSSIVTTVRGWLALGKESTRTVTMTYGDKSIVVDAATPEQQERMVSAFLSAIADEGRSEER